MKSFSLFLFTFLTTLNLAAANNVLNANQVKVKCAEKMQEAIKKGCYSKFKETGQTDVIDYVCPLHSSVKSITVTRHNDEKSPMCKVQETDKEGRTVVDIFEEHKVHVQTVLQDWKPQESTYYTNHGDLKKLYNAAGGSTCIVDSQNVPCPTGEHHRHMVDFGSLNYLKPSQNGLNPSIQSVN